MKSVYIHIPFCKSICSYCDFCKFLHNETWATNYLIHLEKEIKEYYDNDTIKTLYIGGGTPSVLSMQNLKTLLNITNIFKKAGKIEFTFEMNINDITEEKLKLLDSYGVNRISIGVESFDKYNLKYLNRKHKKEDIKQKIELTKKYFQNINVDLIYGIPIETKTMFKKDIKQILELNVPHISTYSLIIEENTILGLNKVKPIDEDKDYEMYEYITRTFKKYGYHHYELSNFARPGYESKHNLNYWNNSEYYGFGLGAHGFVGELRYENTRSFNTYLEDNFRFNEFVVPKKEDMENEIILGLRKLEGIDIVEFFNKYEVNIQDVFNITELIKDGFLEMDGSRLYIPEDKIYIMNAILNKILN
jgi:oxygen-independent coproporphyrinogen-3 oxidase